MGSSESPTPSPASDRHKISRYLELEDECPELAYILREAYENNRAVVETFCGLADSLLESQREFLTAIDEAQARGYLTVDEGKRARDHYLRSERTLLREQQGG